MIVEVPMNVPVRFLFAALFLCVILAPASSRALTVTATPGVVNVSPGTQSPVHLLYTALETTTPNASYTATSTQLRFETPGGDLLGTLERTATISLANSRGAGTELLNVPARIISAVMRAGGNRIILSRTFKPGVMDLLPSTVEVSLRIVPAPAGQFGLTGLSLEFNQPAPGDAPRPTSGGRITVPRNTRGLRAAATVTYNGQGLLRGRWVVDGQPVGLVNRQLTAGRREAVIASPTVPALPTYATGLHTVRFEILEPEPTFEIPSLLYFVTATDAVPQWESLELSAPPARAHLALDAADRPAFSWQPIPERAIYLFRIVALDPEAVTIPLTGLDTRTPVLSARTAGSSYTLSPFDLDRLATNMPYAWQVRAYQGNVLVAASDYRIVLFSGPAADLELKVPLRDQGVAGK